MVKKLQKMAAKKPAGADTGLAGAAGLLDNHFAQLVKDSAQQIWAAGLAAFAKAQGEGGKVFDSMVSEGMKLQKKTQSAAETKLGQVASKMSDMAGEVGNRAGQHWDKLESIFEDRVSRALGRLGVPSAKDMASLAERLDALSSAVGSPKKAPSRKAAAKPAGKAAAKLETKAEAKPAAKTVARKAAAKPAARKTSAKPVLRKASPRKGAAPA
jgi:poly(hydroxyalkanoate) granule-associated protein